MNYYTKRNEDYITIYSKKAKETIGKLTKNKYFTDVSGKLVKLGEYSYKVVTETLISEKWILVDRIEYISSAVFDEESNRYKIDRQLIGPGWKDPTTTKTPHKFLKNLLKHDNLNELATSPIASTSTSTVRSSYKGRQKQRIPPVLKDITGERNFKNGKICYCCHKKLESWDCGHIWAENNGGPMCLNNMRPVCGSCNKRMGTQNMYLWMITNGYGENLTKDSPSTIIHQCIFHQFSKSQKYLTRLSKGDRIPENTRNINNKLGSNKISYQELFYFFDSVNDEP